MPLREQRRVASHVTNCSRCSERAGATLAGKRLLGAKPAEVEPPASSWRNIVEALEGVDGVQTATAGRSSRVGRNAAPALAACGLVLIAAALICKGRLAPAVEGDSIYVRSHLAALSGSMMPSRSDFHDVVTAQITGAKWLPVARWLIPLDGGFVAHCLFRVGDRSPVSEFTVSASAFDRDEMTRVVVGRDEYWVRGEPGGVVVAWEMQGLVHALVGRTKADDLLALACDRRRDAAVLRSY